MEETLVQMRLAGFKAHPQKSSVCTMLLEEVGGARRLSVMIGMLEAKAILLGLERVGTPRPLTHDLMVQTFGTMGYALRKVVVSKVVDGVFFAELHFLSSDMERRCVVDARTSDAVALAVRCACPVFVNEAVLCCAKQCGAGEKTLAEMSVGELEARLQKLVDEEDYEHAIAVREELRKR